MPDSAGLTTFLVYLFAVVLTFLIFREIVCWYWKINRGLELLVEIRDLLRQSATTAAPVTHTQPAPTPTLPAAPPAPAPERRCPACATAVAAGAVRCPRCGLDAIGGTASVSSP
jgi:hypothetical protein